MNKIEPKQSNATHNQQAGFDNPFINGREFNLLGHF